VRLDVFLASELEKLETAGLLREPDDGTARADVAAAAARTGHSLLDASSNDYLGLGEQSVSRETSGRPGAGASRLIHGTTPEHIDLEQALAAWVGAESALLFSSTYAANLGLVAALGQAGSLIVSDASNHASLIDGARLAKGEVAVVPHLDLEATHAALRSRRALSPAWVITESYFSMDGDGPNLPALRALCDELDANLIVDEAHALGVFGPGGAGRCAELHVKPDALVGALGKAVGTHGGFTAGSAKLRKFLWNRARSFVFSTAVSPRHAALTLDRVKAVCGADHLRAKLSRNGERLRQRLSSAGLGMVHGSFGPIVSVLIGENSAALAAATCLKRQGILAQAIRPPTVPQGSARLRLTVKATFDEEQIDRLAAAVEQACLAS
jgi:8-amino-7-oxononanoate synthase